MSNRKSHAQLIEGDDNTGRNEGTQIRDSSIDYKRLEMSPSSPNFRAKKKLQGIDRTPTGDSISDDGYTNPKNAVGTTTTNQADHGAKDYSPTHPNAHISVQQAMAAPKNKWTTSANRRYVS